MNFDDFCEGIFWEYGPFWHLCTPGNLSGVLFREREDYVFGMNMVALCAAKFYDRLKIYTFQIMSNHLHFVVSGSEEAVIMFFEEFSRRYRRYLTIGGDISDYKGFTHSIFPISDLNYLRNVLAYVNRNGYLVDANSTPFSYPWGANAYFFNLLSDNANALRMCELSVKAKRKLFRTHDVAIPDTYFMEGEYVSPMSYVQIDIAQNFFRSAHHYFNLVSRRVETFSSIAKELGDKITYTDDEMFTIVCALSAKKFESTPKTLDKYQKIEIAKDLHFNYNASNKQIKRVLRIDEAVVNSLFPKSSDGK